MAVIDAAYSLTGDVSLIEGNYVQTWNSKIAVTDVDISYVQVTFLAVLIDNRSTLLKEHRTRNGFTLPIVCHCNGTQVTGCMKDLFSLGDCPVSPKSGT